jgi:hypothetical protein
LVCEDPTTENFVLERKFYLILFLVHLTVLSESPACGPTI